MNEKRDYLQVQIEQLGKVLGKILADLADLNSTVKINVALEFIKEKFRSELDIDTIVMLNMNETEFEHYISERFYNSPVLFMDLSELFLATAIFEPENSLKLLLLEKVLLLYKMSIKEHKTYSLSKQSKINSLAERIEKLKKNL